MRSWLLDRGVVLLLAVLATLPVSAVGQEATVFECSVVDVDRVGWERLAALEGTAGVEWWVEADDRLLTCGQDGLAAELLGNGFRVLAIHRRLELERLRIGRGLQAETVRELGASVLLTSGSGSVLYFAHALPLPVVERPAGSYDWRALVELPRNLVLARQLANDRPRPKRPTSRDVEPLVDEVDAQRWFADVSTLATFNRYTPGPGILAARDWVAQQLQGMPGVTVTTPGFTFQWGSTTVNAYNVVGTLPGSTLPDEWYIVGGHYDSTSENPSVSAPGAEDNASGCAGVLEMARVFTANPPPATMLFICYAGEEQGLLGSEDHAGDLVAGGDASKVKGVLDMDMIGYTGDADLDCLLESEPFAQALVDAFADAAAQFTTLRIVTSTYAWGSDHVPYLDRGMPALLTIENDWDSYPYYHHTTDLPVNITLEMGRQVLRMNVGALAELTGAESGVVFRDGFESGDLTAWSAAVGFGDGGAARYPIIAPRLDSSARRAARVSSTVPLVSSISNR